MTNTYPADSGFHFPAEWHPHTATWLSWPHKDESWPGKIASIYPRYCEFIKALTEDELVRINVANDEMELFARHHLQQANVDLNKVQFFHFPTNDAWWRRHGPAFFNKPKTRAKSNGSWGYNAWGNKYPPFDLDDIIP